MQKGTIAVVLVLVFLVVFTIIDNSDQSGMSEGKNSMHLVGTNYLHKSLSEEQVSEFTSNDKAASKGKFIEKFEKQIDKVLGGQTPAGGAIEPNIRDGIDPTTDWFFPLDGNVVITSLMGPRDIGNMGSSVHDGMDFAYSPARSDAKVYAVRDGKVIAKGAELKSNSSGAGRGYYLTIEHDVNGTKYYSQYAHLKNPISQSVGQQIKMGQELNIMGKTSGISSMGIHLHLEMGIEDKPDAMGIRPNANKLLSAQLHRSLKNRWWYKSSREFSRLDPREFFPEMKGKARNSTVKRLEKVPASAPINDTTKGPTQLQ